MSADDKQFDKQVLFSSWQDPRSWDVNAKDVGVVITCATNADAKKAERLFNDLLARAEDLERELAEANARCGRMLDAEQERLLLASEDEIRKEILADGRDPAEYLKAVDKVMKLTGENALLKHDLRKALANHSADLSARGELPAEITEELIQATHTVLSPYTAKLVYQRWREVLSQYVGEKK